MRRRPSSLHVDVDIVAFLAHRVRADGDDGGKRQYFARSHVKARAMTGALDRAAVEKALLQMAAVVRADVVDRVDLPVAFAKQHLGPVENDLFGRPFGNLRSLRREPLGHRYPLRPPAEFNARNSNMRGRRRLDRTICDEGTVSFEWSPPVGGCDAAARAISISPAAKKRGPDTYESTRAAAATMDPGECAALSRRRLPSPS